MDDDTKDWLTIPEFLDRKANPLPPAPGGARKDVVMSSEEDTGAEIASPGEVTAPPPAPKANGVDGHPEVSKPKAKAKPAKAAKATKQAAGKPKAKQAATKPAKAKATSAKPKAEKRAPVSLDQFGYRKGSLKSQAAAIYAGKKGATLGEIKTRLGSTQLNVLTELESKGYKVTKVKEPGDGNRPVTRYRLQV